MRMRRSRMYSAALRTRCVHPARGHACSDSAQTAFVPYFGKNSIRYNNFEWQIYKTDHFEIWYYPEIEKHLERVASFAESAYQHVSAELKHDLASKVPLIMFKTESEFQQQHISGEELPEGVLAFAEPERNRMVLPIDEPSDQLYRAHHARADAHLRVRHHSARHRERRRCRCGWTRDCPTTWRAPGTSIDLMQVRDAALTDSVPKMSEMNSQPLSGRIPYSLGHATFEFIESKWGKDGLRQFLFSLRKSVIGGGDSAYEEALKVKPRTSTTSSIAISRSASSRSATRSGRPTTGATWRRVRDRRTLCPCCRSSRRPPAT